MTTALPEYNTYEGAKSSSDGGSFMSAEDQSSLMSELESFQQVCKNLQEELDNVERVRQQSELTDEARKMAEAENRELMAKLTGLEKWTDCFDQGEAALTMRKIYQDTDSWAKEHYCRSQIEKSPTMLDIEDVSFELCEQPFDPMEIASQVHADLSQHIFQSILARFMVGLNESFGDHVYYIDKEIQNTCTFP
jgi:hypothetical protein